MEKENYEPINVEKILFNIKYGLIGESSNYKATQPAPTNEGLEDLWKNPSFKEHYNDTLPNSGREMLDNILKGASGEQQKETIENLVKQRVELKIKMIKELNDAKESIREMRHNTIYGIQPPLDMQELHRQYCMLDQLSITEEIKCWKDISFLELKLIEETLTGLGGITDGL